MQQMTIQDRNITENYDFNYDGFQVVRGEFFSHAYEPTLSFRAFKIFINAACIKKVPEYDYIHLLVNPNEKKLVVKPCNENEKDAIRWCSATAKRNPKQISCKVFFLKVMNLMNWNPDCQYRLLGKLIRSKDDLLFVFDLNSPEIITSASHEPMYPEEWKNQFGMKAAEHHAAIQINTFHDNTIFNFEEGL